MTKLLVRIYVVAVLLAASWMWLVEVAMRNSSQEHLLPSVLLLTLTMPLSLAVAPIVTRVPSLIEAPFGPLVVLTVAAGLQAGLLVWAEQLYRHRRLGKAR